MTPGLTSLSQIPQAVAGVLGGSSYLPSRMETLVRKKKDIENEIEAALAALGICAFVMPVLPKRVARGAGFIFFEAAELRVRVMEESALNDTGVDVYEASAFVMLELHGSTLGELLSAPLELDDPPIEETTDTKGVVLDVVFNAVFQLHR